MPRVTVLMAVHNGAAYVGDAVQGILAQTFRDFELLVVDDGSTDRTREIVSSFTDPRIRLVCNGSNLGLTRSLNRGLSVAATELVARQDADDVSEPERLERQVEFLDSHPDVALLGTGYRKIDARGSLLDTRRLACDYTAIRWCLLFFCPFVHSSVLFRTAVVRDELGGYDESIWYAQDYELWLRIARRMPVANLAEPLVRVRTTPGSMTSTYTGDADESLAIRLRNLRSLMGWRRLSRREVEARLRDMTALLFQTRLDLDPARALRSAADLMRLAPAFYRDFEVARPARKAHEEALSSKVARRLMELARARYYREDAASARRLVLRAARARARLVASRENARFSGAMLLGPTFVRTVRRLRKWG